MKQYILTSLAVVLISGCTTVQKDTVTLEEAYQDAMHTSGVIARINDNQIKSAADLLNRELDSQIITLSEVMKNSKNTQSKERAEELLGNIASLRQQYPTNIAEKDPGYTNVETQVQPILDAALKKKLTEPVN